MKRETWNSQYAVRLMSVTECNAKLALQCAESADDSYNDGMTPKQAIDAEIEEWKASV